MGNKIYLKSTFGYREDTLKNWQSENPVLERGEISFVRDGENGKFVKIGDGHRSWNQLDFATLPKGEKGDKGDRGTDAVTDQAYNPTSPNAQSGIAIAGALANLSSGSSDFEQIGEIVLTEPVNSVLFTEFDTPLNEYKQIFMITSFNVDKSISAAFRVTSGGRYFMWSTLSITDNNLNRPLGFWHLIEKCASIDDNFVYKSTYPKSALLNMSGAIGDFSSQGLSDNNREVKSDLTFSDTVNEYKFTAPSDVNFVAGSRLVLFGRK